MEGTILNNYPGFYEASILGKYHWLSPIFEILISKTWSPQHFYLAWKMFRKEFQPEKQKIIGFMLFKMRLFARAPPANNQRKLFLYHLKAYLYGFILSRDKYQKKYHVFSGVKSKSEINKIQVAPHISAWEPGVLNIILAPHKNMPAYKKSAIGLTYGANYM